MGRQVYARVAFAYGDRNLDRGEVFEFKGLRNDDKLLGLKFALLFDPKVHQLHPCLKCMSKFVSEEAMHAHKRKPDCKVYQNERGEPIQPITRRETAEMLDMDESKVAADF